MTSTAVAKQEATPGRTKVALLAAMVVASLVALGLLAGGAAHADTTFTVNTTGDENDSDYPGGTFDGSSDGRCDVDGATSGRQCTLRAAIQEANVTAEADTIAFNIPAASDPGCHSSSGVCTISPNSNLGFISHPVTIDGYTQPGAHPNTLAKGDDAVLKIELDGSNVEEQANGLDLTIDFPPGADSSHSVIRGLVINDFNANGIYVGGTDTRIQGNFIGTNPSGTKKEGNFYGVSVNGTDTNNIVGGTSPAARNLISGNGENGVVLGPGSSGAMVWGNFIGTNKYGTGPLGNRSRGVWVLGSDNSIGGRSAAEANKIAYNRFNGVVVDEFNFSFANDNRIGNNSIYSNGALGIDLGGDGPTPNDDMDKDTGPNRLQNKPDLTSATTTGTRLTVEGTLGSKRNRTFTIRFFANRASEPRGYEGRTFLGLGSVKTGANGKANFTKVLNREVRADQRITATATGPGHSTSEFSAPQKVVQQ